MEKKWVFQELNNVVTDETGQRIHPLVAEILYRRGIRGTASIEEFLSARPLLTYDPALMKDVDTAADMILRAVKRGEKICVYGDYDADGMCSVSLMKEILEHLGAAVLTYVPSRFEEGYGLNEAALEKIRREGAGMLLTVDCGSVSPRETEYAKELGMEVIVTDHHNVDADKAANCVLLNPKQAACSYPEKELAGCGVAFKLAQVLQRKDTGGPGGCSRISKADLNNVLDLVAIATIGDIVPLVGENRTLVKYGMKKINAGGRIGLDVLLEAVRLEAGQIKAENLAYIIVPHLNAAGRMGSATAGVDLLTARDRKVAERAAEVLMEYNRRRKKTQAETFDVIMELAEKSETGRDFLLIEAPDAHEGIAGIVAGKVKDLYYRPVAVVTPSGEGFVKGTGRSIPGVNLYELLDKGADLFVRFGGHEGACGFLLPRENLEKLKSILESAAKVKRTERPELFEPSLLIDGVLKPEEVVYNLVQELEEIAPFGHRNEKPCLCLLDIRPTSIYFMGEEEQHVRFRAGTLDCVMFGQAGEWRQELLDGTPLDLAGFPSFNRWNGREKIQFIVSDIRRAENAEVAPAGTERS